MFLRSLEGMNARFAVHRGYVYTGVSQNMMADGKPQMRFTLCQQILGQTETQKIIIDQTMEGTAVEKWLIQGNNLYLALDDLRTEKMVFTNCFYRYQIETGKLETLQTEDSNWGIMGLQADGEDIEMLQKSIDNRFRITRYELNAAEVLEPLQLPTTDSMGFVIMSEAQILEYSSVGDLKYKQLDREGNLIWEGRLPEPSPASKHTSLIGCGSDADGFLLEMLNFDTSEGRLLRIPYGEAEAQTLIYFCETGNGSR